MRADLRLRSRALLVNDVGLFAMIVGDLARARGPFVIRLN
jgi:hypothetical protein